MQAPDVSDDPTDQEVYMYLVDTQGSARELVEQLLWLEEGDLAQQAAYLYDTLSSMVSDQLRGQVQVTQAAAAQAVA